MSDPNTLDPAALGPYLEAEVPGFSGLRKIVKFAAGQSNPTYLIEADSGRYVLRVAPPLAGFPGDDVVADTGRVNAAIEAMVREAPAQYLWIHRRFKRQPQGRSDYYERKRAP